MNLQKSLSRDANMPSNALNVNSLVDIIKASTFRGKILEMLSRSQIPRFLCLCCCMSAHSTSLGHLGVMPTILDGILGSTREGFCNRCPFVAVKLLLLKENLIFTLGPRSFLGQESSHIDLVCVQRSYQVTARRCVTTGLLPYEVGGSWRPRVPANYQS